MFAKLKEAFLHIVTENNNKTHCLIRWTALVGTVQGLGLQFWHVVGQNAPFDFQAFGIGLGALIATVGAALGMKKDDGVKE